MKFYKIKENYILLNIVVLPNSSISEIVGLYGDALKIKLNSLPVENLANKELIKLLSKKLGIPKSNIEFLSGLTQKKKVLKILNFGNDFIKKLETLVEKQ